jgi:hypothetical protein
VVTFNNERAECPVCDAIYLKADLVEILSEKVSVYDAMNGADHLNVGHCSYCDGYQTVFKIKNSDKWLCPDCMQQHDSMHPCQWCNELNSADMEYSYAKGCNSCDGQIGWRGDD